MNQEPGRGAKGLCAGHVQGWRLAARRVRHPPQFHLRDSGDDRSKREDVMKQLLGHVNTVRDRVPKPDAVIIGGDYNTGEPGTPTGQSGAEAVGLMIHVLACNGLFQQGLDQMSCQQDISSG
jgi:hypothetical protein